MSKVVMGDTRSRTRITEEGEFEEYLEVTFFVDDAKHKVEMPKKDFTAEKAEAAVTAQARELVAIKGKEIKL